jgi:hypothetical protein
VLGLLQQRVQEPAVACLVYADGKGVLLGVTHKGHRVVLNGQVSNPGAELPWLQVLFGPNGGHIGEQAAVVLQ